MKGMAVLWRPSTLGIRINVYKITTRPLKVYISQSSSTSSIKIPYLRTSLSSPDIFTFGIPWAMMASLLLLLLASTLCEVGAGAIPNTYTPANAKCVDYGIPVSVSTKGVNWTAPKWTDNAGLIDFVSLTSSRSSANFSSPIGGSVDLNGKYIISGTFCSPQTNTEISGNVLLATHGLGYDRG
jgi:hypothetical protein